MTGAGAEADTTALVVIDVLNSYDHPDAEPLRRSMRAAVGAMASLIGRAAALGAHVIYVNDNYGDWSAGRAQLCDRAMSGADPQIVEPLLPFSEAAFITKARHSIFYETPLDYMLHNLGIERIVLIGQVTEQCILYSALDGYVRHFSIIVPEDAVAHIHRDLADAALRMMRLNMRAEITSAAAALCGAAAGQTEGAPPR